MGDGFSFSNYQGQDLYLAMVEAMKVFFADENAFQKLRRRCMTKDFSWAKRSQQYCRMYSDIVQGNSDQVIPFEEAFAQLKEVYELLDAENRKKYSGKFTQNYHRVIQLNVTGRMRGFISVEFSREGERTAFDMQPCMRKDADAIVTASFDHLLAMAQGTASFDKLFLSGLIRVDGNLAKGVQIRQLLCKK